MHKKITQLIVMILLLSGTSARSMHLVSWANYALHTFCPLCMWNCERQVGKLKEAIELDDYKTIRYLLRYRDLFASTLLLAKESAGEETLEPLVYAAKLGHVTAVDELLKAGADPNSQMVDQIPGAYPSALIAVCKSKGLDPKAVALIVARLLERGADPKRTFTRLKDCDGSESCNHKVDATDLLLKVRQEIHQHTDSVGPLKLAQENGYQEAAAILTAY